MKKILIFMIAVTFLCSCASMSQYGAEREEFETWVSSCKDYKDVAKWFSQNFVYDSVRRFSPGANFTYRAPLTFRLKSGVCNDAAELAYQALSKINKNYDPMVVVLWHPGGGRHYACSFKVDGKLYVMDYGTYIHLCGVHGPYKKIDEWARFNDSKFRDVQYQYKWINEPR
jgi:hypothetical protein